MGFMSTDEASDSITFQWTSLTVQQANGRITQYTITCNDTIIVSML